MIKNSDTSLRILKFSFICIGRVAILVLGEGVRRVFAVPPPHLLKVGQKFSGDVKTSAFFLNIFRLQSRFRIVFKTFHTFSKYFCYFIEYHPIFITFGTVFDYYKPTKNPVNTENIERGCVKF